MPTTKANLEKQPFLDTSKTPSHLKVVRNDAATNKAARSHFLDQISLNSLKKSDYLIVAATFALMLTSVWFFANFQTELEKIHLERMKTW